MIKKKSNLVSAATYALGDVLTKGARFLLLPLYLVYFSPEEVGILAILQAISLGLSPLFANGISMAVTRFYHEYEPRSEQLVATLLLIGLAISGVGTALVATAVFLFLPFENTGLVSHSVVLMWLLSGFLRANSTILERRYVIRGEAVFYRSLTFTQFLLSTTIIFALVIVFDLRLIGVAIGESVAYGLTLAVLGISIFRKHRPDFGLIKWGPLWAYAYPLAIHAIFTWALSYADRSMLGRTEALGDIGAYHVGYLLATVISTVGLSMKNAWLPDFYKLAATDKHDGKVFSPWLVSFYQFMLFLAAAAIGLASPVAEMLLSPEYTVSVPVMKWIVVALVFQSMMVVLLNPLLYSQKTKTIAAISGFSLVVNVVAMLLLIPMYGVMGAAYSTLIAYLVAAALTLRESSRVYALKLPARKLIFGTAVFGVVIFLNTVVIGGVGFQIVWNLALLSGYLMLIVMIPGCFLEKADCDRLQSAYRYLFSRISGSEN